MSFHETYQPNETGSDYVVGDIHGMRVELNIRLAELGFNETKDRLFSVGDLTDRGPDNLDCLALLEESWFISVKGNHEMLMLDVLGGKDPRLWVMNGGGWAFKDGVILPEVFALESQIRALPYAITIKHSSGESFGICHAEPPVDDWADIGLIENDEAAKQKMIWGRDVIKGSFPVETKNISMTIHGHTIIDEIGHLGNALFIDLGCFHTKNIAIINLDSVAQAVIESA